MHPFHRTPQAQETAREAEETKVAERTVSKLVALKTVAQPCNEALRREFALHIRAALDLELIILGVACRPTGPDN